MRGLRRTVAILSLTLLAAPTSSAGGTGTGTYLLTQDRFELHISVTSGVADLQIYHYFPEPGMMRFDGNGGAIEMGPVLSFCERAADDIVQCATDVGPVRVTLSAGDDRLRSSISQPTFVNGHEGDDEVSTSSANDGITGGPGSDTISSGSGDDAIDVRDGEIDHVACGIGEDGVRADAADDVAADCEVLGDMDVDGVKDGSDACPILDGEAGNGCPNIPRLITIRYEDESVEGNVVSEPITWECVGDVPVVVYKVRTGPDAKIGTDKTLSSGAYAIPRTTTRGRYYAKTKRLVIPDVGNCLAATSGDVRATA